VSSDHVLFFCFAPLHFACTLILTLTNEFISFTLLHLALQDLRLNLLETDFAPFVAGMHEISPSLLEKKATEKVVQEFKFLRSNAVHPLSTFLDYMASEMMIENVITLLRGSLTGRNFEDLLVRVL